jgi:hypothetical protein
MALAILTPFDKTKTGFLAAGWQAKTLLSLQLPSKLLFDLAPLGQGDGGSGRSGSRGDDGGDTLGLNLEVQQLDLVVRV